MGANTKEQLFKTAIGQIFIGAKMQGMGGQSGFRNLLNIKNQYFQKLFDQFMREVDNEPIINKDFKEEFYDKLYNFFNRYFSENGSVYFRHTPAYQKIYEHVYQDGRDVALFWKTQMLYYVKSEVIYQSAIIAAKEYNNDGKATSTIPIYINADLIQHKKNNEKKSLMFEFARMEKIDGKDTIILTAQYSEGGKITKTADIAKQAKIPESYINDAIMQFNKQSEIDFFINKNARAFLSEQLDLYLYQFMFKEPTSFTEYRIKQIQTIKQFALKLIDFISQFEDELVRIWNKPKFVKNCHFVITMDKLPAGMIDTIINHEGFTAQMHEWHELGMVDENFKYDEMARIQKPTLPLDTKFFADIQYEILGALDGDLDDITDGVLIHSENYQALNSIKNKYREKVQCIYIDPPFNLDSSDQFQYRTNYKDSNWASLLENRLTIAKNFLHDRGSIFVRCDYNGNYLVRCILDDILLYQNEIILSKSAKLTETISKYHSGHDSLYFYTKSNNYNFATATKQRENPKWRPMHLPGIRWSPITIEEKKLFSVENLKINSRGQWATRARIILGIEYLPPEGRHWALSQQSITDLEKIGGIKLNENGYPISLEGDEQKLTDNWTNWVGYSSHWGFSTENNEEILNNVIYTASINQHDIILDFFSGSGTTVAVAHKLGRKWLGVEMGDHFHSVIMPRMKRVLFYDKSGISKDLKEYKGGGIFKYYALEQYEEALQACDYRDDTAPSLWDNAKTIYEQYPFLHDAKITNYIDWVLDKDTDKMRLNLPNGYDLGESLANYYAWHIVMKNTDSITIRDNGIEKTINLNPATMDANERDEFLNRIKPFIWWGE